MFAGVRNGVIVGAHADDETIWAGGLLGRYADNFSVICCSIPRADPIRAWKFHDACCVLGVPSRVFPFTEGEPRGGLHLDGLDLSGFDLIVTHNDVGEYGNPHHVFLHRFIKERWGKKMATFGYRSDGRGATVLRLNKHEQAQKLEALKCYNHVSPHDCGKPKWQALIDRYAIDFRTESFDPPAG